MMCEFTEEEVCNCISVPRGVGREKLTKALKLPNVVFELSPHTPHSAKYPVSLARRQTEWSTPLTWRDFSQQITESAAIAFFLRVPHAQLGPYHSPRQLRTCLNSL